VLDVVGAVSLGDVFDELAAEIPETLFSSFFCTLHEPFEFGEGLFDGIEVGAVGRQEPEICANRFNRITSFQAFVAAEVIENANVTLLEYGSELLLDIRDKDIAVDGTIDNKRSHESGREQTC